MSLGNSRCGPNLYGVQCEIFGGHPIRCMVVIAVSDVVSTMAGVHVASTGLGNSGHPHHVYINSILVCSLDNQLLQYRCSRRLSTRLCTSTRLALLKFLINTTRYITFITLSAKHATTDFVVCRALGKTGHGRRGDGTGFECTRPECRQVGTRGPRQNFPKHTGKHSHSFIVGARLD